MKIDEFQHGPIQIPIALKGRSTYERKVLVGIQQSCQIKLEKVSQAWPGIQSSHSQINLGFLTKELVQESRCTYEVDKTLDVGTQLSIGVTDVKGRIHDEISRHSVRLIR